MGLVGTATKIGIGYVVGTRAGRQRYEQLATTGKKLVQHPQVQRLAEHPRVQQINAKLPHALQSKLSPAPASKVPRGAVMRSPTSPPVVVTDPLSTGGVDTPLPTDPPSPSVHRFDA